MQRSTKLAVSALGLSLILAACGGGSDNDDSGSTPAASSAASSTATSSAKSSTAASSAAASSTASSASSASSTASSTSSNTSSSSSAAAAVATNWAFNDANYSGVASLFASAYTASGDNGIAAIVTTKEEVAAGTGAVSADGLLFISSSTSVLRYRPVGSANNATGTSGIWNTNGSFFTANTPVLTGVAAGTDITTLGNMRAWMAVPVTASTPFTVSVTYKPTNTTAGAIALLDDTNKILAVQNTGTAQAEGTISYTGTSGHAIKQVRVFYSRDGATGGGVNITAISRNQ